MRLPQPIHNYFVRHIQVALNSLGRLYRTPLASLMTIAVIGIALALPSGLYLLTGNLQKLGAQWDGGANLSVFLRKSVSLEQARTLKGRLAQWPEIDSLQLITPEQALAEFRELSGFGQALDLLDDNPLPAVLAIKPASGHATAVAAESLTEKLRALPEVELAQLDLQWVKRFNTIMEIVQRTIRVMAALLGLAVLLIIGNTIRLEIQSRREEIEITKLIGATDGFIRRPFLYAGLWYGIFGALVGALMVEVALLQLLDPVRRLAGLYQSSFSLEILTSGELFYLLTGGSLLGLAGAWIAVGRHLSAIEPQ
ncbi:cell division protein FtsX [Thiogranum longum]|uniref:Cell division protein FtsX n=1 Tax=Thiogranum longum TaxID=1537524 RepID=A0A4R1HAB0_9GAMM|nr:permease-like cell division protein FtsX [Thiogranum longum]TCK17095.1 cell division protein FtsX [Thiogranum longum]